VSFRSINTSIIALHSFEVGPKISRSFQYPFIRIIIMSTLSTLELPIVNLLVYLQNPLSKEAKAECIKAAQAMQTFSAFAVRDHRVSEADNSAFIDLQESYFSQPLADKMADVRADLHYQVGPTPGLKEMPKCGGDEGCLEFVANLAKDSKPLSFSGYGIIYWLKSDSSDPKWRFFWRIGTPPKESKFAQLNAEPVIPAAFPQWQGKMDRWGSGLLDSGTLSVISNYQSTHSVKCSLSGLISRPTRSPSFLRMVRIFLHQPLLTLIYTEKKSGKC
jgi:hypothetical protein